MKRILLSAALVLIVGVFVVVATGASNQSSTGTYKIQLDNAFGLVTGADFKVAGVPAGTINAIDLPKQCINGKGGCYAVVTVQVTKGGFGQFHQDVTCVSRPESLIGEYYIDCNPGSTGPVLKPGSLISVSHTQSTIPADLVQNIMRLPYRERLTLIINELGAAAAGRSGDLQQALQRAVPALTETDNLLALLGNDSHTLQNLTHDSNTVITALANNSVGVKRFIDMANRTAVASATQQSNLQQSWARLPALLSQLRPAMAKLRTSVVTNTPVLQNLHASAGQLDRLFRDLPGFSRSALPSFKSLGQASVTGRTAVIAARPTITDLNKFAKPTPELGKNLGIVLPNLDTQSNAVEPDPRSPGGKGFSGLQALLGYVFNTALAINTYSQYGHVLAVDAFYDPKCSPYQSSGSLALFLQHNGSSQRSCYRWLGPNQPGVSTPDPSNPGAALPDPGGAPPGQRGASSSAARLSPAAVLAANKSTGSSSSNSAARTASAAGAGKSAPAIDLHKTIGQIITGTGTSRTPAASSSTSSGSPVSGNQAQALLNYLLAP
jgi:virulence factor Mce-like protein